MMRYQIVQHTILRRGEKGTWQTNVFDEQNRLIWHSAMLPTREDAEQAQARYEARWGPAAE